jgi:hypothetical protein
LYEKRTRDIKAKYKIDTDEELYRLILGRGAREWFPKEFVKLERLDGFDVEGHRHPN